MARLEQRRLTFKEETTTAPRAEPPAPNPPPPASNATIGKPIPVMANDMGRYPGRGFQPQNVW